MSHKRQELLNELDVLVRRTSRCGMTDGTVMVIEFVSGFEKFNTRPYHNYETWAQGWRVSGLGVTLEREDLDDAVKEWARYVTAKRDGQEIPRHVQSFPKDAAKTLPDWIAVGHPPSWKDGLSK